MNEIEKKIQELTDLKSATETSTECGWAYLRRNQLRNIGIEADVAHDTITDPTTYNVWNQYDTILLDHGASSLS